jgi:hypothetical protein
MWRALKRRGRRRILKIKIKKQRIVHCGAQAQKGSRCRPCKSHFAVDERQQALSISTLLSASTTVATSPVHVSRPVPAAIIITLIIQTFPY